MYIVILFYCYIKCKSLHFFISWRIGTKLFPKAAREQEEVILKQLEEKEPLPDKEADQMSWVRAVNQHRAIAEEIILKELIYV